MNFLEVKILSQQCYSFYNNTGYRHTQHNLFNELKKIN